MSAPAQQQAELRPDRVGHLARVTLAQVAWRTLGVALILCGLLALPLLALHRWQVTQASERAQARVGETVRLAAQAITEQVAAVLSDLRYLSQQNELRDFLAQGGARERERLALEYLTFIAQKRHYDQVCVIGSDGRERVRVDFRGGDPAVVPAERLQNARERYYFAALMQLSADEVYVSPLDLNVEHGAIELPPKPTLRFALPLFGRGGAREGSLVINLLGEVLIQRVKAIARTGIADLWLLNADGYWLIGPDREDEWGFMFPDRAGRTFAARYPQAWAQVASSVEGSVELDDGWLRYRRVYPLAWDYPLARAGALAVPAAPQRYYWTVAARLPHAVFEGVSQDLARDLAASYAVLAGMALPLSAVLAYVSLRGRALGRLTATVLDQVPALIAYVDRDQRLRFSNRAHERLFGVQARNLDGTSVRDLLGKAAYGRIRRYIAEALAGQPVSFEERLDLGASSPRDVSVSYVPDRGPDGAVRGFFSIISDVTPLRDADRRERLRMLELAHIARVNSLGQMATELAHAVNQPLAAIAAYTGACRRRLEATPGAPDELHEWLQAIDTEAHRAADVVQRLRELVGKGSVQPAPLDLSHVVAEVVNVIRAEARALGVEVELDLAPGLPPVMADRALIEQVVLNLLRNALEAVVAAPPALRRVTVASRLVDGAVQVEVRDTGPGVPADLGGRVFDAFVTTKPQGLGMGLAVSRTIVEAHEGRLEYETDAGVGTMFRFVLPVEEV